MSLPIHPQAKLVPKGWGYEVWLVNKEQYCGKILHFDAGKRCSMHYHKMKDETFYLASGRIVLVSQSNPEINGILNPGAIIHIPTMTSHQMIAAVESEIIEFSTQHFEEDSYRIVKGD